VTNCAKTQQQQQQQKQQPQQVPNVAAQQGQLQGSVEVHEHIETEEERKNRIEILKRMPWLAFKQ
jgi:hypothetical protein